jgi:hypothetical protein
MSLEKLEKEVGKKLIEKYQMGHDDGFDVGYKLGVETGLIRAMGLIAKELKNVRPRTAKKK